MDLRKMHKFFEYQPVFDPNPDFLIQAIIEKAKTYIGPSDIKLINKTYKFAKKAHEGTNRLSWEPYIIHPLQATLFLMEMNPDPASIQTCLLHDVIEDTPITYEEIQQEFWEEVATLCEGLVKVSKIKYKGEERQLETLKKTFIAMAHDLRVIFIKLADRIHNVQTLQYHPKAEKRIKIAEETMQIYVPIAKRLGLYDFQVYLENASFKILHPDDFNKIFNYLKKTFGTDRKYKDKGIKMLNNLLIKEKVHNFDIEWRLKSPHRIYQKMQKKYQSTDISNVMDLLAYRIITQTETDCYMILWIIHKHYTPLIKKIKDYIAVPKANWYRSIHTTVLWIFRFPTEIQIRTEEMDDIAKFGVAAHFKYSETWKSDRVQKSQAERIQKIQTIVQEYKDSSEKEQFKDKLNIEILDKSTFLYTPQWEIIELPINSTVLDFAFRIHSNIWLSFKNALVNGEIKPISFIPKNGDLIQINTFKNKYSANKHRLDFLHTPSAKSQLNRYLRQINKEEIIKRGTEELNKSLKKYKLPLYKSEWDQIKVQLSTKELENKLIEIIDKKSSYSQLIRKVYPSIWDKHQKDQAKKPKTNATSTKSHHDQIIVDLDKHINYKLCPECNPQPNDQIIARTGKDGIKIHTTSCKAIKTINFNKLLEAHWIKKWVSSYKAKIILQVSKNENNMVDIFHLFTELHIKIIQIKILDIWKQQEEISLIITFKHPNKLTHLFNNLKKQTNSIQNIRKYFIIS